MTNIYAVIPAHNESLSIKSVVRATRSAVDLCLVVDDGSLDKTAQSARRAGAKLIRLAGRTGTANATKVGLQYVIQNGADIVCLLDGDGQHDPRYIPILLTEIDKGADLVIGSRFIKPTRNSTSLFRRLGTRMISFLIWIVYKKRIYDPTSGFRAMNQRTLKYLVDRYPVIFPEPEVAIDLINHGFVIKEVSVEMRPRMYGKSSIGLVKAFYLMTYIIQKILYDWVVNTFKILFFL